MRKLIESADQCNLEDKVASIKSSILTFLKYLKLEDFAHCEGKEMKVKISQDEHEVVETFLLEDALEYEDEEWDGVIGDIIMENSNFLNDRDFRVRTELLPEEEKEEMPEELKKLTKEIIKDYRKVWKAN